MLGRYALTFARGDLRHRLRHRAADAGLDVLHDTAHLLLIGDGSTAYLASGNTVLLGELFDADGQRAQCLPHDAAGAIPPGWWGGHALFAQRGAVAVVHRDPSGAVPVYGCTVGGARLFTNDAATALDVSRIDPTLDERFLVSWLQFPFLRAARTGLRDVRELLPGVEARGTADRWTETNWWQPSAFTARDQQITDRSEASRRLSALARAVVPLQATDASAALQLSGGLDSSIVACCLAQAGKVLPAITFATTSSEGDERRFARDVARQVNLHLVEREEAAIEAIPLPAGRDFRPTTNPLLQPLEDAVIAAAAALGCTTLIDGAGGDNLFCHLTSAAPVIDALVDRGPCQALRTLADIGERANANWWQVAGAAGRRIGRRTSWKENRAFLLTDALADAPDPHPWLEGLGSARPGKREHVEALVHIQHFLGRGGSSIARVHPLMAQPLLELCLRIPSWLWVTGGRDRAIAREAFAADLPPSVSRRRTKGSLQGLFTRSFAALLPVIRERLLFGALSDTGVLDRTALELATRDATIVDGPLQLRLSEMLALELWLEDWRSLPHGRA